MRHLRRIPLLVALLLPAFGCEHFTPYRTIPEATGPIAAGAARVRVQNNSTVTITETWYAPCLAGGEPPLKVPRTIRPGQSTQQDVTAGCIRLTLYHSGGAFNVTVTAPEGAVTTVTI